MLLEIKSRFTFLCVSRRIHKITTYWGKVVSYFKWFYFVLCALLLIILALLAY